MMFSAEVQAANTFAVDWSLDRDHAAKVKPMLRHVENIRPDPSVKNDNRALPVIVIVAAIVTAPEIIRALLDVYKTFQVGVELLPGPDGQLIAHNVPSLPYGTIVVKDKDARVLYEGANPTSKELGSPIEQLEKLGELKIK